MPRLPDFEALAVFARVAEEGSYPPARTLGIAVLGGTCRLSRRTSTSAKTRSPSRWVSTFSLIPATSRLRSPNRLGPERTY